MRAIYRRLILYQHVVALVLLRPPAPGAGRLYFRLRTEETQYAVIGYSRRPRRRACRLLRRLFPLTTMIILELRLRAVKVSARRSSPKDIR